MDMGMGLVGPAFPGAPKRTGSGPAIVSIISLWQLGSNKNITLIVRAAVSYREL